MKKKMENRIDQLEKDLKETSDKLTATKEQLRLQNRRARQLVAACSAKVQEKEREMQMLRVLKDGQLQSIIRKLLHFESILRQEQKKIVEIVLQKDSVIQEQSTELEQLRQANRKLLMAAAKDDAESQIPANASKLAKLNSGQAKTPHRPATATATAGGEDKENLASCCRANPEETPLVTKMVRRFELPLGKKPEVPKKPIRLIQGIQRKADAASPVAELNTSADSIRSPVSGSPNPDPSKMEPSALDTSSDSFSSVESGRGVSRADSVNDHGYFTLEKRKPVQRMEATEIPTAVLPDEMDLRHNFEEFHLDSLEEEDHFPGQADGTLLIETPPLSLTESPIRSPGPEFSDHQDRSSGDGAEWSQSYDPPQTPPPSILSAGDCTSLSVSGSMLLPQLGDATPTAVQFDRFLDVSGLTQKSILTPSRLLSNHKNMLKPKDVKHRSKVKAVMGSCRLNEDSSLHHQSVNQVRYYVEPFL